MKKNRGLFFAGLTFAVTYCSAQTINPSVISPAGNMDKTESISLDWTLGETTVKSVVYRDQMITEGFHQPFIKVISIENENLLSKYHFLIAPNPVQSILNLRSFSDENIPLNVQLTDLNGKILSVLLATSNDSKDIDMSSYVAGIYILSIKNSEGITLQSFRVFKAQ